MIFDENSKEIWDEGKCNNWTILRGDRYSNVFPIINIVQEEWAAFLECWIAADGIISQDCNGWKWL